MVFRRMAGISGLLMGFLLFQAACTPDPSSSDGSLSIHGIYGSPQPFWERGWTLGDLGVNAVFVHGPSVTDSMLARATREGARVFAEFPTLNGKGYVEEHPEAWAVDQNGDRVESASWFLGVCPTEPGFRTYRMRQARDLLRRFDLDGLWMDYVHWHAQFEEPEPILPETCFCDHCLTRFQAATGVEVPEGTTRERASWILANVDPVWRDWRASVIAGWARDLRTILRQERPEALLGVYHSPWNETEFDGAQRRILGIDYDLLRETVDVFSPMVYHGRMGRSPEWVRDNIAWFTDRIGVEPETYPKVWPIVQASDEPRVISPSEFEAVLRFGVSEGATGVMMFTSWAVATDSAKTEVMRRVYGMRE